MIFILCHYHHHHHRHDHYHDSIWCRVCLSLSLSLSVLSLSLLLLEMEVFGSFPVDSVLITLRRRVRRVVAGNCLVLHLILKMCWCRDVIDCVLPSKTSSIISIHILCTTLAALNLKSHRLQYFSEQIQQISLIHRYKTRSNYSINSVVDLFYCIVCCWSL